MTPLIPRDLPRTDEIALDHRALFFTLAATLLANLLFGLLPAVQTARINLTEALKDSGRTSSENLHSRWLRKALVVSQVALTVILLIGAGLMTNSLVRLYRVDPGFNSKNLLAMSVSLRRGNKEPDQPDHWARFWQSSIERALQVPGVQGAAVVTPLPLGDSRFAMKIGLQGGAPVDPSAVPLVGYNTVSNEYFRLMGIGLLQGRYFSVDDKAESPPVVVVNESLARTYFPGQDPIGRGLIVYLGFKELEKAATIVGVVSDSRARLDEK